MKLGPELNNLVPILLNFLSPSLTPRKISQASFKKLIGYKHSSLVCHFVDDEEKVPKHLPLYDFLSFRKTVHKLYSQMLNLA
jgi:hypothetical protein